MYSVCCAENSLAEGSDMTRQVVRTVAVLVTGVAVAGTTLSGRTVFADGVRTVDLSTDVSRQVVVAAGTEKVYNGHPTTVLLDDDRTLFCFWPTGHGGYAGNAAVSRDAGRTWSRIDDRLPDDVKLNVECPLVHRLVGPDGKSRLWVWSGFRAKTLAEARAPVGTDARRAAARRGDPMPAIMSEDDGATWKVMPPLGSAFRCVLSFQAVVRLKDGSYLGIYHRGPEACVDRPPLELMASITRDGGFTWSEPQVIAKVDGLDFCEPWAFRSPDGSELCVLIRENHWLAPSKVIFSRDEGKTWTAPRDVPPGLTGHRHQGVVLPDGRVVVCMRDTEKGSSTVCQFVAWVGSYESIRTGKASPGDYKVKLLHSYAGGDCGYPGVHLLKDGTIVATTYVKYRPDACRQSIVSVRFKVSETDALVTKGEDIRAQGEGIARKYLTALMEGRIWSPDRKLTGLDECEYVAASRWNAPSNSTPVVGGWKVRDEVGPLCYARWTKPDSYCMNAVWCDVRRKAALHFNVDTMQFTDRYAHKVPARKLGWGTWEVDVSPDPIYAGGSGARLLLPQTSDYVVTDFRTDGVHVFDRRGHYPQGGSVFDKAKGVWTCDFAAADRYYLWHHWEIPGVPDRFRLPFAVPPEMKGVRIGLQLGMGGAQYEGVLDDDFTAEPPPSPRWKVIRGGDKGKRGYPMRVIQFFAERGTAPKATCAIALDKFTAATRLIDDITTMDVRIDSTTGPLPRKLTVQIHHEGAEPVSGDVRVKLTSWEGADLGRMTLPVSAAKQGERRVFDVTLPLPDVTRLNYYGIDVAFVDAQGRRLARYDWQKSWVRAPAPYVDPILRRDSFWGMNCCLDRSFYGCGGAEADRRFERRAALAEGAGVKWNRGDFAWPLLEPAQGRPDWSRSDRTVATCRRHGLAILGSIGCHWPSWVKEPWKGTGLACYTNFLAQAARRYKDDIREWEIWNEANWHFWEGTDADYFKLLEMSAAALRAVDPAIRVVGGSTAGVDLKFLAACVTNAPGCHDLAHHPYRRDPDEAKYLADLQRVAELKPGTRQWLTEMGAYTGCGGAYATERTQGVKIFRQLLTAAASGYVAASFLYDLVDDGDDTNYSESNFGVLRADFSPKPGYRALALLGRTFVEGKPSLTSVKLTDGKHTLHTYRQGRARAVWTDAPFGVRVPLAAGETAVNLMDEPLVAGAEGDGRFVWTDVNRPVVIVERTEERTGQ